MTRIDHERELRYICRLLPDREERKALSKHLGHLNEEIVDREDQGESTFVMQLAFDCLMKLTELMDAIKDVRVAMNGGRNDD